MGLWAWKGWPRRLSDEQYVERIRKSVDASLSHRVAATLGALCLLALALIGMNVLFNGQVTEVTPDEDVPSGHLLFMTGLRPGIVAGFALASIVCMVLSCFPSRGSELLVKSWDRLHPDGEMDEGLSSDNGDADSISANPCPQDTHPKTESLRFFGMKVRPDRLSDEQLVARTRKMTSRLRVLRYFFVTCGLILLLISVEFSRSMLRFFFELAPKTDRASAHLGFGLGVTVGSAWILLVLISAALASRSFVSRHDQLLVKCWDALHAADEKESTGWADQ
jgi:hypothetical protein